MNSFVKRLFSGQYSLSGVIRLAISLLRTKLFYGPARLIRFPIDIRGRHQIVWLPGFTTGRYCRLEVVGNDTGYGRIRFGRDVQINDNVHVVAKELVEIGDNVLIASKVFISDCSHGSYRIGELYDAQVSPAMRPLVSRPVRIEARVWLGDNVVVMPGVTIGEGSIIGASSVVTKDIPPRSLAVGSPAKVIRVVDPRSGAWVSV